MNRHQVTALVATCNRAHFLGEALDSILSQTIAPDQVIVVDDGSTDGTRDVLRQYGDRIEVIEQPNGGKSRAINAAMPHVLGTYLWIFDDDDVALPNNIECHLAALEAHPGTDFVFSSGLIVRNSAEGQLEHMGAMTMPDVPEDEIFPRMLEGNFMQQQAMLVRTQCYREVGPFDVHLERGQDYEMNLRLARRFCGRRVKANSFLFRQHEGPRGRPSSSFSARERRRRWVDINRELVRGLRAEVALEEYLPLRLRAEHLSAPLLFRSLLQRGCVMSRCGLWKEALEDMNSALLDVGADGIPMGSAEKEICARALSKYIDYDVAIEGLLDDRSHACHFKRLVSETHHPDVVTIFASQLNRYVTRRWRKGDRLRALHALYLMFQISPADGFRTARSFFSTQEQTGVGKTA